MWAEAGSRSAEIQRLVGRALRAAVDLEALGPRTITIDCDVLQGDRGHPDGFGDRWLRSPGPGLPLPGGPGAAGEAAHPQLCGGVSAGIVGGEAMVDLCYVEDSQAAVDFNCVMNGNGNLIESRAPGRVGPSPRRRSKAAPALRQGLPGADCIGEKSFGGIGMKVVLASKNPHKLVEISAILKPLDVELVLGNPTWAWMWRWRRGSTFEENSFLKANAVRKATGLPALADDSGIAVDDALGALPGCIPPGTGTIRPG